MATMEGRDAGGGQTLSLGELIDAELQFAADRAASGAARRQLMRRDAQIAEQMDRGVTESGGQNLRGCDARRVRFWLGQITPGRRETLGRQVDHHLEMAGVITVLVGLLIGAGLVWGWLAAESGRPVNVIHLWAATVGVQTLLLVLLLVIALPAAWLSNVPGAAGVGLILRSIGSLVPWLATRAAARLSPGRRQALEQGLGEMRRLESIYGRARLLITLRLTQMFAVAFNLGAIASLVAAVYVTDPAFGWRSRMLAPGEVHAISHAIATPWSWAFAEAAPSRDEVELTQYTLLEQRFTEQPMAHDSPQWGAWWPFLLASLVGYGLLPRVVLLATVTWRLRAARRRIMRDHPDFQRLCQRLLNPTVQTQSDEAERPGARPSADEDRISQPLPAGDAPCHLLLWAGVDDSHAAQLPGGGGGGVADVHHVGQLDAAHDASALQAVQGDEAPVVLIVQAWEPPVGDYVDFLQRLRAAAGPQRPITVMLFNQLDGEPAPPDVQDLRQWRSRLAVLGDAWLSVQPFTPGTLASHHLPGGGGEGRA